VDLWTGPLARASRLNAQGRSPVDGRMDNPAGCPRAHPQAVGCPQAPQGPTTGDAEEQEIQAIPRAALRHRRPDNVRQGGPQPARPHSFLQSQARNPAPSPRSVTFPKSPVTFAEIRSCGPVSSNVRRRMRCPSIFTEGEPAYGRTRKKSQSDQQLGAFRPKLAHGTKDLGRAATNGEAGRCVNLPSRR